MKLVSGNLAVTLVQLPITYVSKEQAAELKQTKHQLQVAELTARYQRDDSIQASELVGLKKKELALILGIEKYERKKIAQLQDMIQSNGEKNADEIIEENQGDSEEKVKRIIYKTSLTLSCACDELQVVTIGREAFLSVLRLRRIRPLSMKMKNKKRKISRPPFLQLDIAGIVS